MGTISYSQETCLPFHLGLLFKEKICSSEEKILYFNSVPFLEWVCHPGKQTGSHQSCFPLKNGRKT